MENFIDFYTIELPQGSNKYMLCRNFQNMPVSAYFGTLKDMEELKEALNKKLNEEYNKEGRPELIPKF